MPLRSEFSPRPVGGPTCKTSQVRCARVPAGLARTAAVPPHQINPQHTRLMASLENLHDLFVHELRDLFDAENQLIRALPLMAKAATSERLREGFDLHLRQTKEQVRRLEQLFQGLGVSPEGKHCNAMAGLVAEAEELLGEDADPDVMDAGLIVAAQKVEHYEIAGYGSVRRFAEMLGYKDAAKLLEATLKEESQTDEKLTQIAQTLNTRAKTADEAKR
jgi:ferritin-like metal-binding protein YciE